MVIFIKVLCKMNNQMEMVCIFSKMVNLGLEILKKENLTEKENIFFQMVLFHKLLFMKTIKLLKKKVLLLKNILFQEIKNSSKIIIKNILKLSVD